MRIRAKRCRYAAELASPVIGKPARDLAVALARVQDVLGEHQDAVVADAWLAKTAPECSAAGGVRARDARRDRARLGGARAVGTGRRLGRGVRASAAGVAVTTPPDGLVRAAGGLVTRRAEPGAGEPGIEVLVVHRPRYDDWSLPKGKVEPGESDEDAARREVEEETGYRCTLGEELPTVRYIDRRGVTNRCDSGR